MLSFNILLQKDNTQSEEIADIYLSMNYSHCYNVTGTINFGIINCQYKLY